MSEPVSVFKVALQAVEDHLKERLDPSSLSQTDPPPPGGPTRSLDITWIQDTTEENEETFGLHSHTGCNDDEKTHLQRLTEIAWDNGRPASWRYPFEYFLLLENEVLSFLQTKLLNEGEIGLLASDVTVGELETGVEGLPDARPVVLAIWWLRLLFQCRPKVLRSTSFLPGERGMPSLLNHYLDDQSYYKVSDPIK